VAEVEDTALLVEKLVALGGAAAPSEVVPPPGTDLVPALKEFLDREEALLVSPLRARGVTEQGCQRGRKK